MAATLLFQFRQPGSAEPSLTEVGRRFGFEEGEIDADYGVVKVADDAQGALYAILVDSAAKDRLGEAIDARYPDESVGFFANPAIGPFGPPQP
jgi:hypothetical protein